jgi:YYY domain-containing protein
MAVLDYLNIILWFILIELLSLISMPLAGTVCNNLADRGYSTARALGIVLVTYISWILSYIWGFNRTTILISVLALCLLSMTVYRKQKYFPTKKILLSNELIFAAGFIFFLIIRVHLSEIYGQEKFMDFGFLNAMIRTSTFPPADPWFAGGSLNFYYYFGYLSVGALGKLCSVEPSILFNLAIAFTIALSLNLFFGIGYNLTKGNIKYGVITAISGVLLGNIRGSIDFVSRYIIKVPVSGPYYWNSSRVIPYTINEFPYFSFIQGDLHPHMLAIPFSLLVLTFLLNMYFRKNGNRIFENYLAFLIFSLSLGFLFPTNSWDFPVYLSLTFLIVIVFYYGYYVNNRDLFGSVSGFLKTFISISAFSLLLYLPFYMSFNPKAAGGFGYVGPEFRTTVDEFLVLFGLFLFLIFLFLFSHINSRRKIIYFVLLFGISALLSIVWSIPMLLILFPLLVLSILSLLKNFTENNPSGFISLLIAVAALIALLCELVYLRDNTGGNFYRMNTVFKFYMHLWTFLSIAASYSYYELYSHYKTYPLYYLDYVTFHAFILPKSIKIEL